MLRERIVSERPADPTVWQPDSSQEAAKADVTSHDQDVAEIVVQATQGKPTLRVAYFFAGKSRNGSIGSELKILCKDRGFGLIVHEIDILNGGNPTICWPKTRKPAGRAECKRASST